MTNFLEARRLHKLKIQRMLSVNMMIIRWRVRMRRFRRKKKADMRNQFSIFGLVAIESTQDKAKKVLL